jgi:hypothetical protein
VTGEARRVIVVVDDLRTFAFDAVHARTSAQGIDLLRSCLDGGQAIDELWLDYNLGRGDTGSVVVAWLVTHADEMLPLVGRVNVHSSDPGGARRMMAALAEAGYDVARRWPGEPGAELR